MKKHPIHVTIITGFLGSGKTTFLNSILNKYKSTEFLIIENEVGEINIDRSLLQKTNRNKVYELTNGCICCSLSHELGTVLNSIILSNMKYEHMLVEATGIADPAEIVRMFIASNRVQRYFKLDSVVSLVDASLFLEQYTKFTEIRKQIAPADLVLVNKTDLVKQDSLKEIEEKIGSINPFADIAHTSFGDATKLELLNRDSFRPAKVETSVMNFSTMSFTPVSKESSHNIESFSFTIPGYFNMQEISTWLESFLIMNAQNILRIKGILSVKGIDHKIILQSVGQDFHVDQGSDWTSNEEKNSQLVFIGTKLNRQEIEEKLKSLSLAVQS